MVLKICASQNCYNTQYNRPDLGFFSFPKSERFSRAWVEACKTSNLENKSLDQLSRLFLCAEHFEDKCFMNPKDKSELIRRKEFYALPTLFKHNMISQDELVGTNPSLSILLKECNNSRLKKICRLCSCLKPTLSLIPIYGSFYEPLMKKLKPFGIYLEGNDSLPTQICMRCAAKLLICVETLEQFTNSERKLKSMGSKDTSTLSCNDEILEQIVEDNCNTEANQNDNCSVVSTSSPQNEPEPKSPEETNVLEIEEMKIDEIIDEVRVKTEVIDNEDNADDLNNTQISSIFVKQEVEDEAILPMIHSGDEIPLHTIEKPKDAVKKSMPDKSKSKYENAYDTFVKWQRKQGTNSFTEVVLLAYFHQIAQIYKPTTLWTFYSMLKATINHKQNINIENYKKLLAFLKKQNTGYESKKSQVLTPDQIERFLNEASDFEYLDIKVALIIGVFGSCRGAELCCLKTNDVKDLGSAVQIKILDSKTNLPRSFVIEGGYHDIVKKYMDLRPKTLTSRFFLNYQYGKCTQQVIGKNKIGTMPKKVAHFLKLEDPESYTGHSFRRTAASLLTDSRTDIISIKRQRTWKSGHDAQGYVDDTNSNKRKRSNVYQISGLINSEDDSELMIPLANRSDKDQEINFGASTSTDCDLVANEENPTLSTKTSNKVVYNFHIGSIASFSMAEAQKP